MRLILIGMLVLLMCGTAMAEKLVWDPPTTYTDGTPIAPGDLVGYNAYETTGGRVKLNASMITHSSACVGTTTPKCSWTMSTQTKGDTFLMTAVDSVSQESSDSNTATFMGKRLSAPIAVQVLQ